jgi:hypothetical protein
MEIGMTTLLGSFRVADLRRGSFLRGFASALDLRGNSLRQYRFRQHASDVDRAAIQSDWEAVGNDLRAALGEYERAS